MNHARAARHARHRRSRRQSHVDRRIRGSSGARKDPQSPYRDWYVWSKKRPPDHDKGMVFPGVQKTTWTCDAVARRVLLPSLLRLSARSEHDQPRRARRDHAHHGLLAAARRVRLPHGRRAVPDRAQGRRTSTRQKDFELLHEMRDFLQWRRRDAILLAEANVPPDESLEYFGELGDRLQMMLNFPVNQRLFYALATGDIKPLVKALEDTYRRPHAAQWVQLPAQPRRARPRTADRRRSARRSSTAFGPTKRHAALRPRHPPAARADARQRSAPARARVQPAVHAARHADAAVRRRDRHGRRPVAAGARVRADADAVVRRSRTAASRPRSATVRPVIDDPIYGYKQVNVEAQRRDPQSLLNWTERTIRMRKECPEISWGDWKHPQGAAQRKCSLMRYDWDDHALLIALHNFTPKPRAVHARCRRAWRIRELVNLLAREDCQRGRERPPSPRARWPTAIAGSGPAGSIGTWRVPRAIVWGHVRAHSRHLSWRWPRSRSSAATGTWRSGIGCRGEEAAARGAITRAMRTDRAARAGRWRCRCSRTSAGTASRSARTPAGLRSDFDALRALPDARQAVEADPTRPACARGSRRPTSSDAACRPSGACACGISQWRVSGMPSIGRRVVAVVFFPLRRSRRVPGNGVSITNCANVTSALLRERGGRVERRRAVASAGRR